MRAKYLTPKEAKELSKSLDNQRTIYLKHVSFYIKAAKTTLLLAAITMILITILTI
jgi:hypothetical protein